MKKIIAIVGMPGAGKTEAAEYLATKGTPFVRFGEITEEEVKKRGLPLTSENERIVREAIRREGGMGAYALKAEPKINTLLAKNDVVVIDGLYSWEEYTYLKDKFPDLTLINVYAGPKVRYERLSQRSVRPIPIEECYLRDVAEIEKLNKGGPIAIADYTIENNSNDISDLYRKIDSILSRLEIRLPAGRQYIEMIQPKTPNEISIMQKGGKILAEVLDEVLKHVKPGVSELELDLLAERLITEKGGEPAFKKVKGYNHTICVSTNNVVVHGVPTNYRLEDGDIVGIDCGVYYKGFNTDAAETRRVSTNNKQQTTNNKDEVDKFLETGKRALEEAIKVAKVGNRVWHISKTIQDIVEGAGYSVVRSFVGHGVGRSLHEEPEVPGFLARKIEDTPKLRIGMTIAIEVIYNMGKSDVILANDDGWTIKTKDGSLAGLFERTVAVTNEGPLVLTQA